MWKAAFATVFWIWLFQASPATAEVKAVFTSEESIKEAILTEVESAASTLELAVHDITSPMMANALLKAKQRGVKVRIVADSKQAKAKTSQMTYLIHQGIMVKTLRGKERGVMNHRFAVLDGKKIITGSYDWTENSEKWNHENVVILADVEAVASYQKEFDRLWRQKRVIK